MAQGAKGLKSRSIKKRGQQTKKNQEEKRRPKPRKNSIHTKIDKKISAEMIKRIESISADQVTSNHEKLHLVKADKHILAEVKKRREKRQKKHG